MAKIRRPFPQLNPFREWVSAELKSRKRTWPTPINTPFLRMTSCNEDLLNRYKYFTLGLHGFDINQSVNLFELTYGSKRDVVGYAYRNGRKELIGADEISYQPPNIQSFTNLPPNDPRRLAVNNRITQAQLQQFDVVGKGSHPIPGITGAQIKRNGTGAAPLTADVAWQCYNQQQLEFLRNHFLVVGSYIVLEWGQQYHNRTIQKFIDFGNAGVDQELTQIVVKGRKYVIENYSEPNEGNYDLIVAQVGNFTVDFDPALNIYKCSTRLVSVGENVWGLGLQATATVISIDPNTKAVVDPTAVNKLSDIHSYFEGRGCRFDILLGQLASSANGTKYICPQQPAYNADADNAAQAGIVGTNPYDYSFISWNALTNDVFNDIIEMFKGIGTDSSTKAMYDKLCKDLRSLLGLGGPPSENLPSDVLAAQKELYDQDWIGNNRLLRSTDPNTMILITPEIQKINLDSTWTGNGIFGTSGNDTRARLTEGVWVNAAMVREAFLKTTTLQAAIQQILSCMNSAVAGYWQLQLFYDDEISVYKVIDYKFEDEADKIPFYVFNSHSNDHHNEVVDIKFDSAFPPELITQMMVVSMILTSSPEEQKILFDRYPMINNASPFIFAVNWTSLTDILKKNITAYRNSYEIQSGTTPKGTPIGTHTNETVESPLAGKLTDSSNQGPLTGKTPTDSAIQGQSRSLPGSAPSIASANEPTAPEPRSTVTPPKKFPPVLELAVPPVSNPVVTSGFGSRNAPTAGASTQHKGVDIKVPQGTPVYASVDGIVRDAGFGHKGFDGVVYITAGNYEVWYGHVSKVYVVPGQHVKAGELIALSGGTPGVKGSGTSTGPHLHFEIRYNGVPQNPVDSLSTIGQPKTTTVTTLPAITVTAPAVVQTAQSTTTAAAPSAPVVQPTQISPEDATALQNQKLYVTKFGNNITNLVYLTNSQLRNKVTEDGYKNISNQMVNSFISPFPTKTSVELKLPGIAGISITDGFMVDKLPFIFANYGVFQTTEVSDTITEKGWYTTVRGYFKMIWPEGTGGTRDE